MKTILYFTADWCQPCKKVKPIVEELNREYVPGMFQMIDIDIEKEMAKSFQLKSVPTFILFENGNEINRIIGAQTKQSLLEFIGNE
jgi:thiol-disulfide isomerase/thioredoxin